MILACLYESFLHPLTIIAGLPSAAFGGLLTLWLFGLELDLYGFVGLFMLIGIVKKNAIMVVDFALEAELAGKSPLEAAIEGSIVRFRPIMMTTIAAIAGMTPIAVGYGAGGDSRQPLGPRGGRGPVAVTGGHALLDSGGLHVPGRHPAIADKAGREKSRNPWHTLDPPTQRSSPWLPAGLGEPYVLPEPGKSRKHIPSDGPVILVKHR